MVVAWIEIIVCVFKTNYISLLRNLIWGHSIAISGTRINKFFNITCIVTTKWNCICNIRYSILIKENNTNNTISYCRVINDINSSNLCQIDFRHVRTITLWTVYPSIVTWNRRFFVILIIKTERNTVRKWSIWIMWSQIIKLEVIYSKLL